MKSAEQWQEELAGETSVEAIRQIQTDAMFKREDADDLRTDLVAALVAAEQVLQRIWDEDEMGWLTDSKTAECGQCRGSTLIGSAVPIVHDPDCLQGVVVKAFNLIRKAKGEEQGQSLLTSSPTEDK